MSKTVTGRPPKNMCKPCKGWGTIWFRNVLISYYGDGAEKSRDEETAKLDSVKCNGCDGTGFTGGKLRTETPPILQGQPAEEAEIKVESVGEAVKNFEIKEVLNRLHNPSSEARAIDEGVPL